MNSESFKRPPRRSRALAAISSSRTRSGIHLALQVLTLTLVLAQPTHADYQSGLDAYHAGQYTVALEEWLAVVDQPGESANRATFAETHYAIGILYWRGQGVEKDYFEASKWLHRAGELGHAGAQGKLGYLYAEGITVEQDYGQAFEWFSKAAKQGDVDGQYNLGIFYLNGWGVEQDKTMAAQYLAAASAQGDESAEAALQGLLPMLSQGEEGDVPLTEGEAGPRIESGATGSRHSGLDPEPQERHSGLDPEPIFFSTDWILSQNPSHYTIQVIGLSTMSRLEKLVAGQDGLAPLAVYTVTKGNKPLYLLVQGVYKDVKSARSAVTRIPAAIQQQDKLWIRQFGKIQELILAQQN